MSYGCRQAGEDMVVGGYRIPKGTAIQMPSYAMHMSASNFTQPYRFWPERWQQDPDAFPKDPCQDLHVSMCIICDVMLHDAVHCKTGRSWSG